MDFVELYYEDELPGLVGFAGGLVDGRGDPIVTADGSYQPGDSLVYPPSEINDGGTLLTTVERPPR